MELTPTQLANLQAITLTSSKVRLDNLTVGQELLAKVIATNANGEVTLNINNAILNARTSVALTEGQLLQLIVSQTGKQIMLQLPQKMLQEALTQQILRESLPKQQPLNQTVQLLQQTLQQASQLGLPQRVTQSLQNFINRLPTTQQLSDGRSLKEAIKSSGIFLEKSITQMSEGLGKIANNDLKALLSQLRNSLVSEKNVLSQQPQVNSEIKTTLSSQPLATTVQQTQINKQDVTRNLTAQTILQQTGKSDSGNAAKPATTVPNPANTATKIQTQATSQQIETALNIKATQSAIRPLGQTPPVLPAGSQPTPATTFANGKPVIQTSTQYGSGRQAASIKEALAINTSATSGSTESAGLVSRFSNLIELLDQLIKHVDSSLARTQLHQLNTLQDQDAGKLAWSLEIPVQQEDETHLVKLEIEKENAKQDSEAVVTVNLAVNLEQLGPVYSRVTLAGNNIGVVFWAEQEYTFELARDNMSDLETNLEKSGFNTPKINCHHGQPPQMRTDNFQPPDKLLDIKV